MELAGSHVALIDRSKTRAGCESIALSILQTYTVAIADSIALVNLGKDLPRPHLKRCYDTTN